MSHLPAPPGVSFHANGEGQLGALIRAKDWSTTPLGPMKNWPESLKQYVNMMLALPTPAIIFWGDDQIQIYNDGYAAIMGPRHPRYLGSPYKECWPDTYPLIYPWMRRVLDQGEAVTVDRTLIPLTRKGYLEDSYFNFSFSPLRDDGGKIAGILQLVTEVTDQVEAAKRLEHAFEERTQKLRESESFLDSVIENLPSMVFVKDAVTLKFVRFNRAGEELLGLPRSELIGKSDYDFFPKEQADHFVAKDREVLASGKVLDVPEEFINTKKIGERILHTRKIPILDYNGKPEFLLGISEDITDWKFAMDERLRVIREQTAVEERQRENDRTSFLAEASTLLARSLSYDRTLHNLAAFIVPAMADWCTVTMAREDGINERVSFVHRDPSKALMIQQLDRYIHVAKDGSEIDRVIRTGQPIFMPDVPDRQLEKIAEDQSHLELMRSLGVASCIVAPIVSRDKPIGAISFVAGPARRRYNQADLAMAVELGRRAGIAIENASLYESVQRAVETRDEFMSVASHELKTPLTSLKLQAQIRDRDIRRGNFGRFTPENLPKLVAEDGRQLDRLIRLVEDMLDVSRINSGKIEFNFEEFDLCEMIEDAVSRFSPQFELAGIPLSMQCSGPIVGQWDRFRIEQVFANLLSNAIKYGNKKPVEVCVAKDHGLAILTVRDHGLGIAPRDQTRIFEQFERAISGSSISGLGLGLFISKKIVESHHGTIKVESAVGEGSTFSVELPLFPQGTA